MGKKLSKTLTGTVQGTRRRDKQYAFFIPDNKDEPDVFIPKKNINGALHGDKVVVEVYVDKKVKKPTANVLDVVLRMHDTIVGKFQKSEKYGFVIPNDSRYPDIYIPNPPKDVKHGDVVVIDIIKYSAKTNKHHTGKIKEVIGFEDDDGIDILSVAHQHGLPLEFPDKVMMEVENIPDVVTKEDIEGRLDLRDVPTVTIDGDDAKDFDDAISISRDEKGNYILGVHIADVTHYVRENSPLDKEALKRGTSVYLVDRVIPMLPKKLSNGICSLNPNVDRLVLSCIMTINKQGKVLKFDLKEAVINSNERMTYANVTKILDRSDKALVERYRYLLKEFDMMKELSLILRKKRMSRGALDFNFPEGKIELNEHGVPVDVHPYPREISNRIIEEFMLVTNETIAEFFCSKEIPFVYRIHEDPDEEKLESFIDFANGTGYQFVRTPGGSLNKDLQKILQEISGKPEEDALGRLMLRSLMQAKYSPSCYGHFGLAAEFYCHHTSPIRRYPDLQIHRIIKEYLHGDLTKSRQSRYQEIVEFASLQSSERERLADEIEEDIENMKKAEYMSYHLGECFEGTISNVCETGIIVTLPSTIEGLILLDSLDDDVYYYDEKMKLIHGTSGVDYKLGQKLLVEATDVKIDERKIYFELVKE